MKIKILENAYYKENLIRFLILFYWSVYWLFNSIDKYIAGSQFLWVGKDRFAQFLRYFDSAGWDNAALANFSLIIVAVLEIFAFLFFTGALIHLIQKRQKVARSMFSLGIGLTLTTFTLFSIGDHIFGDRFELLEHTLFWVLTLFSWVIYVNAHKLSKLESFVLNKNQSLVAFLVFAVIFIGLNISIIVNKHESYHQRREAVVPTKEGENLYKCTFPFLAGSTAFEKTLDLFKKENPNKAIMQIYTVPSKLRKQKADALIVYITTRDNLIQP
jgi:hypothetical protein